MSQLVGRILLAIFVFPLAGIFYTVLFILLDAMNRYPGGYRMRETYDFLFAGGATWVCIALYWWLLWRTSVRWTAFRVLGSLGAAIVSAIISAIVGSVCGSIVPGGGSSFGAFVGSTLCMILWLIATVFVWRETRDERRARLNTGKNGVTCPICGYNLTGLSESRCPECGTRFTLDELLARQREAAVDLA